MRKIFPNIQFKIRAEEGDEQAYEMFEVFKKYPLLEEHVYIIESTITAIKNKIEIFIKNKSELYPSDRNIIEQKTSESCQVFFYLCLDLENNLKTWTHAVKGVKGTFSNAIEPGNEMLYGIYMNNIERNMTQYDNYHYFMYIFVKIIQKHFPNSKFIQIE